MSKKAILLTLAGILLVAALVITNFGRNIPFLSSRVPVYTAEIPPSRPERLDQRLLERFEGETMANILAILAAEQSNRKSRTDSSNLSDDPLVASLPDAPFPFDESAEAKDADWLTDFVTTMKREEGSRPSPSELWRFNLALSALKISPHQLPKSLQVETSLTPETDSFPVQFAEREHSLIPPLAIGNFDGSPDIEILDQGGTRFNKVSESGEITSVEGHGILFAGSKLVPADYDRDGDLDVLVLRPEGFPNSLYKNGGNGTFTDVTIELGLLTFNDTTASSWIDYDNDGQLDLLEGSSDHPLKLFHQTAGGSFQPIAWDLKLWVHRGVRDILCADFSGDGVDDFFLELDDQEDRLLFTRPAESWDGWRFEDVISSAGIAVAPDHTAAPLDFNQDGAIDLALFGANPNDTSFFRIFVNLGDEKLEDATEAIGFKGTETVTSLASLDIDQDGYRDLYLGTRGLQLNRTFWNRAGIGFREITIASRGGYLDAPVITGVGDFDRNGFDDLLYENDEGTLRWIEPRGSHANTAMVSLSRPLRGAQLIVTSRDRDWILQTTSYALREETFLSLGIGEGEIIEELKLLAPDGETVIQQAEKLPPNEEFRIEVPPPAVSSTTLSPRGS